MILAISLHCNIISKDFSVIVSNNFTNTYFKHKTLLGLLTSSWFIIWQRYLPGCSRRLYQGLMSVWNCSEVWVFRFIPLFPWSFSMTLKTICQTKIVIMSNNCPFPDLEVVLDPILRWESRFFTCYGVGIVKHQML